MSASNPILLAAVLLGAITGVAASVQAADVECMDLACRLKNAKQKGGSGGPFNPQSVRPVDDAVLEKTDTPKASTLRTVP